MTNRLSKTIDDEKINRIIQIESAGNPDAKAGTSSAGGLGQFLNGTWDAVGEKYYPDEKRRAGANWRNMRVGKATAQLQLRMLARFCEENAKIMGSTNDGDLYLAHFLGAGAAQKVVRANQNTPATSVVGEKAAQANRTIIPGKTCGELRAWAEGSMRKRWDVAGRKDWVGIWGGDLKDIDKTGDAGKVSTEGKVAGGIVAGGGAIAGGAAAAGLDWGTIAIFLGLCGIIGVSLFFIIRARRAAS